MVTMDILFVPLIQVVMMALNLYWWIVVSYTLIEWLEFFNIINRYNHLVYNIHSFLYRLVDPVLLRIRAVVPPIGGVDLSPVILIFCIFFLQGIIARLTLRFI